MTRLMTFNIFYATPLKITNFFYQFLAPFNANVGVVPARLLFLIPVRGAGDALVTGAAEDNWVWQPEKAERLVA